MPRGDTTINTVLYIIWWVAFINRRLAQPDSSKIFFNLQFERLILCSGTYLRKSMFILRFSFVNGFWNRVRDVARAAKQTGCHHAFGGGGYAVAAYVYQINRWSVLSAVLDS